MALRMLASCQELWVAEVVDLLVRVVDLSVRVVDLSAQVVDRRGLLVQKVSPHLDLSLALLVQVVSQQSDLSSALLVQVVSLQPHLSSALQDLIITCSITPSKTPESHRARGPRWRWLPAGHGVKMRHLSY